MRTSERTSIILNQDEYGKMHFLWLLAPFLAIAPALAGRLFAAVQDGTVQTLNLDDKSTLSVSNTVKGCGTSPSWLTLGPGFLYCSSEATPGSLSSFGYCPLGNLKPNVTTATTGGDVSSAIYGDDGQYIALAHYGRNSISTYTLPLMSDTQQPLQNLTLPFPGQGPNKDRQSTGYAHQVILDPSGRFIFSPDLGADQVRVFSVNQASGNLTETTAIKLKPGSGPRHAAFYKATDGKVYVYIVSELTNTLSGYRMDVVTDSNTPVFTEIFTPSYTVPPGANLTAIALAEVRVQGTTLTTSNRFDASLGANSDTLTVLNINDQDGTLSLIRQFPSGGSNPRSFQINRAGDLVAVGNQNSKTVVIWERDPATGVLGREIAKVGLSANVVAVIWME